MIEGSDNCLCGSDVVCSPGQSCSCDQVYIWETIGRDMCLCGANGNEDCETYLSDGDFPTGSLPGCQQACEADQSCISIDWDG